MKDYEKTLDDFILATRKKQDWKSPSFSWDKAYICSLVSLITYNHIPDFEVKGANRLNIVPCEQYRNIFESKVFVEARKLYQNSGQEGTSYSFRFVEREMIIALVAKTPTAIFVALRGTENKFRAFVLPRITTIKDWLTNIEVRGIHYPERSQYLFHRGFYNAVESIYDEVIGIVVGLPPLPIYITGHSLGGAMAAIMNARWLDDISRARSFLRFSCNQQLIEPVSCYVFGMPRYGNRHVVKELSSPYHVYNQRDGVPTVPPRFLGYSDANTENEFCLSETDGQPIKFYHKGSTFIRMNDRKIELLGVSAHLIECYIKNVKALSQQPNPEPRIECEDGCVYINGLRLPCKTTFRQ